MVSEQAQQKRRRPIRLRDYDYTQPGMYFFTICTHNRESLFGVISNGEMFLNVLGLLVWEEWRNSAMIRQEIGLDAFVVMPNHAHGVVLLKDVGATGRSPSGPSRNSLGAFIAGFKAATTKRVNMLRHTPKACVWQRSYYDHVIRNEDSLTRIREYILNNPLQWDLDPENPNREGDRPVAPTLDPENRRYGFIAKHGR